jgi:hypothetical protein
MWGSGKPYVELKGDAGWEGDNIDEVLNGLRAGRPFQQL